MKTASTILFMLLMCLAHAGANLLFGRRNHARARGNPTGARSIP